MAIAENAKSQDIPAAINDDAPEKGLRSRRGGATGRDVRSIMCQVPCEGISSALLRGATSLVELDYDRLTFRLIAMRRAGGDQSAHPGSRTSYDCNRGGREAIGFATTDIGDSRGAR
ncbi:MAG: hypothetical protein WA418_31070 [Bradyrhizobium sp.]